MKENAVSMNTIVSLLITRNKHFFCLQVGGPITDGGGGGVGGGL